MIGRPLRRLATAVVAAASTLVVAACASVASRSSDVVAEPATGIGFRLLGVRTIPHGLVFDGTVVGGLSGIDRDPVDDRYYLISDDRSIRSPTRFYTARLAIDDDGFHDVVLQSAVTLRRDDGTAYPRNAADAEAIRFDPATRTLWWSSEGLRRLADGHRPARLVDPFVRRSATDGTALGELPLPPMFHIVDAPRGPRDNIVFEGLSLSPDGRSLWVAMEGPLLQDGPMPTIRDGAWSRWSRFDRDASGAFGALAAQYAYRIDPVPPAFAWTSAHAQSGVSEILAIERDRFLVVERTFVVGPHWHVKLFEADVSEATDVAAIDALADDAAPPFVPIAKFEVLDFDRLGIAIDNLEGLCFGPTLANGHRTLVLVSDDNFSDWQTTQFIALEVVPR